MDVNILNEVALLLAASVDWGTLLGLLLAAAAQKVATSEHGGKDADRELCFRIVSITLLVFTLPPSPSPTSSPSLTPALFP